ncbi:MAG: PqqD family protein [Thiogranum sp.]
MHPKTRTNVTVQQVGDESLVLDLETEQIHQLNATAAWILSRCDGSNPVETIIRDFAETFALAPETATRDVGAILEQLALIKVIDQG